MTVLEPGIPEHSSETGTQVTAPAMVLETATETSVNVHETHLMGPEPEVQGLGSLDFFWGGEGQSRGSEPMDSSSRSEPVDSSSGSEPEDPFSGSEPKDSSSGRQQQTASSAASEGVLVNTPGVQDSSEGVLLNTPRVQDSSEGVQTNMSPVSVPS